MTDANGRYDVTIRLVGPSQRKSTQARVQKPGYEPAVHWVSVDPDTPTSRDLRLHPIHLALPGQPIRLTISSDDPDCGFEGYMCRRIRIALASAGTLEIEAEAPEDTIVTVVQADQEPWPASRRLAVTVPSTSIFSADVVILAGPPGLHQVVVRSRFQE